MYISWSHPFHHYSYSAYTYFFSFLARTYMYKQVFERDAIDQFKTGSQQPIKTWFQPNLVHTSYGTHFFPVSIKVKRSTANITGQFLYVLASFHQQNLCHYWGQRSRSNLSNKSTPQRIGAKFVIESKVFLNPFNPTVDPSQIAVWFIKSSCFYMYKHSP